MSTKIQSGVGTDLMLINQEGQALVKPANPVEPDGTQQPNLVGSLRLQAENDAGTKTGTAYLKALYADQYFRLYCANANLLDQESFVYTAQNTGKFFYANTTMTIGWTASGLTTNASSITTITTGVTFSTYAMFPLLGNTSLEAEISGSFSEQPVSNTVIDFGLFQRGGANPYEPVDGVFFRLTSAGMQGVISSNGIETNTGIFSFTYTNSQKYKFYLSVSVKGVEFWIDDILYAILTVPNGQGQPFLSSAVPFSLRHAITGGASSGVLQFVVNNYSVISLGTQFSDTLATQGNRIFGSFQGISGGTMGSLAVYPNSANPTPAVPTNTTSTVLTGLGGQGWETDTLAVNTDGIIMSYLVPAGTVLVQGKRLKLTSIKISSFVQTTLTGGGYNASFALCFGHTAVSLATTESATGKAPRRIALGSYSVPAGATALTQLPDIYLDFAQSPVYVNPGEFIAIAKKKIGTAPSAGVIAYQITPIYSWE
jgi:hypothetical protein